MFNLTNYSKSQVYFGIKSEQKEFGNTGLRLKSLPVLDHWDFDNDNIELITLFRFNERDKAAEAITFLENLYEFIQGYEIIKSHAEENRVSGVETI